MHGISQITQKRIFELWFAGFPRDTIAQQVGISGSTVSKAASTLPESIGVLRELSTELLRLHKSPHEAKEGAEFLAKLAQLGIGRNELRESIGAVEKICRKAAYEPKEVIQGAMRLAKLEAESGKSYPEALQDFQTTKDDIRRLKERKRELRQKVFETKEEERQALARKNLTEEKIEQITTLEQNLGKYDIKLENVESLQKYLGNMQETGGNPREFVRYTEEEGSLKLNLAQLRSAVQLETDDLKCQQQDVRQAKATKDALQTEDASLREECNKKRIVLSALLEDERRLEQKYQETLVALAKLLEVEAEVKRMNEALASRRAELHDLDDKIAQRQQRDQALESKNQSLEGEILRKLKIGDYATELETAIASQESLKTSLEKENSKKQERLALADVIFEFLIGIPTYDFNRLCFYVEEIMRTREKRTRSYGLQLTVIEEQTRTLALKAFEGRIASTQQYRELMQRHEDCRRDKCALETKVSELETKRVEDNRNLERAVREKQLLEALRVNFEGRPTTLAELKNWTLSTFGEEIERRADEKFNAVAAAISGGIDFLLKNFTGRVTNQRSGQQ